MLQCIELLNYIENNTTLKLQFNIIIQHHLKAIHLLSKIGAKCDLAEAYYGYGQNT